MPWNRLRVSAGDVPSEMKRLRELEHENARLRIVADLSLDKEMLQDVVLRKYEAW
jgi:putative transposase